MIEPISSRKRKIAPSFWFGFVLLASIVLSIGGFFYGAAHDPTTDGGRGGALAVMIAFSALFVRSDFALQSYRATAEVLPEIQRHIHDTLNKLKGEVSPVSTEPPSLQELSDSVNGIFAMIRAIGADQFKQNIYVALASAVGTFRGVLAINLPSAFSIIMCGSASSQKVNLVRHFACSVIALASSASSTGFSRCSISSFRRCRAAPDRCERSEARHPAGLCSRKNSGR
jgi:hypothetical protein